MRVKEWKKILHTNSHQKRARVAIVLSDKRDFKAKIFIRDKKGHYVLTKESNHQENITIVNKYTSKKRVLKYMKQK